MWCSFYSAVLIKKISCVISDPLSDLIFIAVQKGVFPKQLSTESVIPTYKKRSKTDVNNYMAI